MAQIGRWVPVERVVGVGRASIVIRSQRDPSSLALPVQKLIAQIDPEVRVSDVLQVRRPRLLHTNFPRNGGASSTGTALLKGKFANVFAGLPSVFHLDSREVRT